MSRKNQREVLEASWRSILRRYQRSGLTVRAFCREHGLAVRTFYGWRLALAQGEGTTAPFVPVQIVADPQAVPAASATGTGLELALGGKRLLRIGPGFDAGTLRRLLAVLEEGQACC